MVMCKVFDVYVISLTCIRIKPNRAVAESIYRRLNCSFNLLLARLWVEKRQRSRLTSLVNALSDSISPLCNLSVASNQNNGV